MRTVRLCVSLVLAIGLVAAAPAAAATRPPPGYPSLPETVVSDHFVVHYTAAAGEDAITPDAAATLSGNAEFAYARLVGDWSYPAPLDDGDGKTDIYVWKVPVGAAAGRDEEGVDRTTGFIVLPPASATFLYAVAHEFFHVIQFGIYARAEGWLNESTAEWAGQNVHVTAGGQAPPNWYPSPWTPLNCTGSACADHDAVGYRGSIFMEYLDERFGMAIVREVFERAAQLGDRSLTLQALADAIAAHGTSLGDVLNDFAVAAVAGTIDRPGVTDRRPAQQRSLTTGSYVTFNPIAVPVDHLAFSTFGLAGGDAATGCETRSLELAVDLPAGVASRPVFVVGAGPTTIPLAVAGATASASIPWSTCAGSSGTLVLANGSTTLDGQVFAVRIASRPPATTPPPEPPDTPSSRFSATLKAGRRGVLTLAVTTHMAGRIRVTATTTRHKRKLSYGGASARAAGAGTTTFKLKPKAAARKLLKHAKRLKLSVRIVFTPPEAPQRTSTKTIGVRWRR